MKVQEFIDIMNGNKNKMLKEEQRQQVLANTLELKTYLPIKEKKVLVDRIVTKCILFENGIFKFDEIDKYICFTMYAIETYTNLELSADIEDDYDMLCASKLMPEILNAIKSEYNDVNTLLQMKCDYILMDNNIEAQFGKLLTSISDMVGRLVDMFAENAGNFDMSNLPVSQEDLNKIIQFVNK
jgi:hypothetical protein